MQPPQELRIKRKRDQDPLQALILEDRQSVKRSKPSSPVSSGAITPDLENPAFYFKLARTDASNLVNDPQILSSILAETSKATEEDSRNFVIPKKTEEDDIIPNELSDMVNDFVIHSDTSSHRKKRQAKAPPVVEEDEYVYDVYQLAPITDQNHPKTQIGYIKFFEEEDEEFNGSEPSVDKLVYSDHEDSNAEDYYQNDYPEDEDADIEGDIHNEYGDTALELEPDQINDLYDYVQLRDVNLLDNYNSGDDLDYVISEDEDEDDDEDDDFDDYDEEFPRQKFFDNESDDEMAMHRDKIFGKLQKMIDEESL